MGRATRALSEYGLFEFSDGPHGTPVHNANAARASTTDSLPIMPRQNAKGGHKRPKLERYSQARETNDNTAGRKRGESCTHAMLRVCTEAGNGNYVSLTATEDLASPMSDRRRDCENAEDAITPMACPRKDLPRVDDRDVRRVRGAPSSAIPGPLGRRASVGPAMLGRRAGLSPPTVMPPVPGIVDARLCRRAVVGAPPPEMLGRRAVEAPLLTALDVNFFKFPAPAVLPRRGFVSSSVSAIISYGSCFTALVTRASA